MTNPDKNRIAELNDKCRTAPGLAGKWVQTAGINALPFSDQCAIREKIELYSDFTPANDPHGERDFGAFTHNGHSIVWKIDYYNLDMTGYSENPVDPRQTVRVLIIMLAEEY